MNAHTHRGYPIVGLSVAALTVVAVLGSFGARAAAPAPSATIRAPRYTVTDLGTLGGPRSKAYGINDRGQVVGGSDTAGGAQRAFVWQNGRMRDLGTLGGRNSLARRINDKGQVVGEADTASGAHHAFMWSSGKMRDLGTFGGKDSTAHDINNTGEVVGTADIPPRSAKPDDILTHAFRYRNGRMRRLVALNPDGKWRTAGLCWRSLPGE